MSQQVISTAPEIQAWCVSYIAKTLNLPQEKIDPSLPVDQLGLDSATAVALIMDLESQLDIELAPELLFEYPTLSALAKYLSAKISAN